MRIVAAGEYVIRSGKVDCIHQSIDVKVNRVIVKLLEILARRLVDVRAAFLEGAVATVPTFGNVGNRAAQMTEHPGDIGKTFCHTTEYQLARSQRRVKEKSRERRQPVIAH